MIIILRFLELAIVMGFYELLQFLFINIPFKRNLLKCECSKDSISVRSRYRKYRVRFFSIYVLAYILISGYFQWDTINGKDYLSFIIKVVVFMMWIVILIGDLRKKKYVLGNISVYSKEEYLLKKRYSIFLRGFQNDDYSKKGKLQRSSNPDKFSEYTFISVLRHKASVCAIGMTKETDSPYGADRVYVDDATWKEDVYEMMDKSSGIYILVDNRDSCLWEIKQTREMQDKTVYIINDFLKYDMVRTLVMNEMELPEIPESFRKTEKQLLLFMKEGKSVFVPFKNTIEEYSEIFKIKNISALLYRQQLSKRKKQGWIFVWFWSSIPLIFAILAWIEVQLSYSAIAIAILMFMVFICMRILVKNEKNIISALSPRNQYNQRSGYRDIKYNRARYIKRRSLT